MMEGFGHWGRKKRKDLKKGLDRSYEEVAALICSFRLLQALSLVGGLAAGGEKRCTSRVQGS